MSNPILEGLHEIAQGEFILILVILIIEADKNSGTFVVLRKSKQPKLSLSFARNPNW